MKVQVTKIYQDNNQQECYKFFQQYKDYLPLSEPKVKIRYNLLLFFLKRPLCFNSSNVNIRLMTNQMSLLSERNSKSSYVKVWVRLRSFLMTSKTRSWHSLYTITKKLGTEHLTWGIYRLSSWNLIPRLCFDNQFWSVIFILAFDYGITLSSITEMTMSVLKNKLSATVSLTRLKPSLSCFFRKKK